MAVTIEDVESRTLLQQFHKLYEKQKETQEELDSVSGDLEQETQNRTNADIGLQESIQAIQSQLDALGNVFTLKGSVATVNDLPAENNKVGDVWYVVAVSSGYVWIDDDGTERWEQLGLNVDLSNYATQDDLTDGLATKQDTLTAGTNISIINNVISASGGASEVTADDVDSEQATQGQILTADGQGGASWEDGVDASNFVKLDNTQQIIQNGKVLKFSTQNGILSFQKSNNTDEIRIDCANQNFGIKILGDSLNFAIGLILKNRQNPKITYSNPGYGTVEIDIPHKQGTMALQEDYGYKVTVNVEGGTSAYACVWGKWQLITQTTTLSNCSMVCLNYGEKLDTAVNGGFLWSSGATEGDTFVPTSDNASVYVRIQPE